MNLNNMFYIVMDKKNLEILADISKIKINDDELSFFLKSFDKVEFMLEKFSSVSIGKNIKLMDRILNNSLNLKDLNKIQSFFLPIKLSKENIKKNAFIENDKFIFKKK
ncbi:MAG: hypothetical protein AM1032_000259 [Mycoplasmataceae bacterium]|nr:MAG: hypothetical protein AM1032_000259 [Mycoplasmataceae bacterium]